MVDVNRKFVARASGVDRSPLMPQELRMLSSKAKYALRALLRLVENASAGSWLQTGEVAELEQVPRKFLEAIMGDLREASLVEGRKGKAGGYRLAHPQHPTRVQNR